MRFPTLISIAAALVAVLSACGEAVEMPKQGDWVKYKVMRASEWIPATVESVTITLGSLVRIEGVDARWWQMVSEKEDGASFVIQALSQRAPMTTESGDIGIVFRYIFRQEGCPAVEYVDATTGLAYLPMFGFRDGLIPTPRYRTKLSGSFTVTGNYLGQALSCHGQGSGKEWMDLEPTTRLSLDSDLLIGTARWFKDDGTGKNEEGEYTYIELTQTDYNQMIDAGFNVFMVNNKHEAFVRDRNVFFIKAAFGKDYPEMLYRSNYFGPTMFTDEPAVRLDTSDCRTVYDAANLLRLRNYAYHRSSGSIKLDRRLTQSDGVIRMIQEAGYNVGDWLPLQTHVPVWETMQESAFYQLEGGAAGIVHEGRYELDGFKGYLEAILGPGVEPDVSGMYAITYSFLRGAARSFGGDWGTAIYGQADYTIAPQAIRQAYDMGARYIWWWTSDHDHHLPFPQQLELSKIMRAHQKSKPRMSRVPALRSANVAVAMPDGYNCTYFGQWWNPRFRFDKLNEFGVPYGDITAEVYWQAYRLWRQGIDFDIIVNVPDVIDHAGYDRIIRVGADGRTSQPAPVMPTAAPALTVEGTKTSTSYRPAAGAPKTTAEYAKPGSITIDGKLDEWKKAEWISLEKQFVYDVLQEKWNGPSDLSAEVAFIYDEDAVYIAARIRDDVMNAEETGDLIWQNDSLQVAFDPLFNPHPQGAYALDDSEIGFSLVDGKPYAHRWDQQIAGPPGEVPGAEVAIIREDDMTIYEARVPFSELWPLTPSFPGRCGVNVAANDSDVGLRKGALAWTPGLADGKSPSSFGVLEFKGADKLKNASAMAFAQVEKTVVKRGEDLLFRLDTGSRSVSDGELTVTLRHNDLSSPSGNTTFKIPAGVNRHQIKVSTDDLQSDSYKAEIVLSTQGRTAVRQVFRVYVLP